MSSYYSPIYSRSSFTPSSSGLHYFNTSPPHEGQMWATNAPLTPTSDDYGSPKGGLPAFQRLTSSSVHYSPTARTNHFNYGSQVSVFFLLLLLLFMLCSVESALNCGGAEVKVQLSAEIVWEILKLIVLCCLFSCLCCRVLIHGSTITIPTISPTMVPPPRIIVPPDLIYQRQHR